MWPAEEFSFPKNHFIKEQPYSTQTLNDSRDQHTGAQFSFLNHMRLKENTNK